MILAAIIIFNFLITIYIVFGLAILYHLKKYRWENDLNLQSAFIFVVGSLFFIGLTVFAFITLPWNLISI